MSAKKAPKARRSAKAKPAKSAKKAKGAAAAKTPRKPTKSKAAKRKTPTAKQTKELDDALGEAVSKIGGIMTEMGYTMTQPAMHPLELPSGQLLVCDLAFLPSTPRRGRIRGNGPDGRRLRGFVVDMPEEATTFLPWDTLPGSVNIWATSVAFAGKALTDRLLARIHPATGSLLVCDPSALAGLRLAPPSKRGPRDSDPSPIATMFMRHDEGGVLLSDEVLALDVAVASSGFWKGLLNGRDAVVVHMTRRHTICLREGLDAEGKRVSLFIDSLRDGVDADPVLRKIRNNERARERRAKAAVAAARRTEAKASGATRRA